MKFLELTLGSHMIAHGYDDKNKEIIEKITVDGFSKKMVAISRIKSVSETYILTDYIEGRWIYWEYEESFEDIKNILVQ